MDSVNTLKQKENWISLLKFFAALLITNSHCREIYPFYFLAVGGGWGNALFFFISGFLLQNIELSFGKWYGRRLKRLLPAICIFLLIDIFVVKGIRFFSGMGFWQIVEYCFTRYWFTTALMIYYVIYYEVFMKENKIRRSVVFFSAWVIGYVLLYTFRVDKTVFSVEPSGFRWFKVYFYLGIIVLGGFTKSSWLKIKAWIEQRKARFLIGDAVVCFLSVVLWVLTYAMISVRGQWLKVQFLIHFSVMVFTIGAVLFWGNIKVKPNRIVNVVADSTLEIFLIQVTFIEYIEKMAFPFSWFCLFGVALIGGTLVHFAIDMMCKRVALLHKK